MHIKLFVFVVVFKKSTCKRPLLQNRQAIGCILRTFVHTYLHCNIKQNQWNDVALFIQTTSFGILRKTFNEKRAQKNNSKYILMYICVCVCESDLESLETANLSDQLKTSMRVTVFTYIYMYVKCMCSHMPHYIILTHRHLALFSSFRTHTYVCMCMKRPECCCGFVAASNCIAMHFICLIRTRATNHDSTRTHPLSNEPPRKMMFVWSRHETSKFQYMK